MAIATTALAVGSTVATAEAAAGRGFRIDFGFGQHGLAKAVLGPRAQEPQVSSQAMVRDSHGRIVYGAGNGDQWIIHRFTTSGKLDPSFGQDGTVTIPEWGTIDFEGSKVSLSSAAIRPDGRILLVGFAQDAFHNHLGPPYFLAAQLMPDGSLDHSFGKLGTGSGLYGSDEGPATVALQPDGKYLTAGYFGYKGVIARFTANGRLDRSFGKNGRVFVGGDKHKRSWVLGLAVLPSGKIVAGGTARQRYMVMRLRPDGSYDRSFGGGDGKTVLDVSRNGCRCELGRSIALDAKGRILITGYVPPPTWEKPEYGATARFTRNGKLDRSFAKRGIARIAIGKVFEPQNVAVDRAGGVIVAGSSGARGGPTRATTLRYLPNGKLDRRFFRKGRLIRKVGSSSASWRALPLGGRKLLIGGEFDRGSGAHLFVQRLVRL